MSFAPSTVRERRNWSIHLLYIRQEFDECLAMIEQQLKACNGLCEYPLYVKGLLSGAAAHRANTAFVTHSVSALLQLSSSASKARSKSRCSCFKLQHA